MFHYQNVIGYPHDQAHVVFDQNDGDAAVRYLLNELVNFLSLFVVQTGRGFIQQQQFWFAGQGSRDLHPLQGAVGE